MGWGFKRGILERRRGEVRGDWGIDREREVVWLLPGIVAFFLRVEDGRYWRYANPSIQASNQIESPHHPDRREEYACK